MAGNSLTKLFSFLKENKAAIIILGTCGVSIGVGSYSIAASVAAVRLRTREIEIRQEVGGLLTKLLTFVKKTLIRKVEDNKRRMNAGTKPFGEV